MKHNGGGVAGDQGRNGGPHRRQTPRTDLELERILLARHSRLRRGKRKRRSIVLFLAIGFASVIALAVTTVAFTGRQILLSTCSLNDLRPLKLGENSFLYTNRMQFLGVVPSATNRQPLALAKISPWLPEATVAIEDARFWQHGALDYQGIARALYQDVSKGHIVQGGSTITQELVRNLYIGNNQRTLSRKLKEACLAEKVFQRNSRKEILADYLNEVFYGRHAYGAEAAAQTYFSKSASDLSLVQAALLAGLPQAPTTDDPILNKHAALARRNEVLKAMWKNGYITATKLRHATKKPLLLRPGHLYTQLHQPNFFGWATQQLANTFSQRQVELGGLRARTTLDTRLQGLAVHAISSVLHTSTDPASALVAIDPRTGAVKAMVDYLPSGRRMQFNFATQAHRSTGSSFKPITLATALSEGDSLYSTFYGPPELHIITPECQDKNGAWDVHNYADEAAGTMNLLDATANSVNTIFAQLIAKVGVRNVKAMAHALGITSSGADFRTVCAMTLGSVGFTPLEMADVYATFASGGIHHTPQAFESVRGPNGKLIGGIAKGAAGRRVIGPNVAAELTYALQGVVQHGTGTAAALGSRPVAGKTGTAENFQDAWCCGYVPQLATCVWIGYPGGEIPLLNVEGVGSVAGGTLPAEIWHDFMGPAVGSLPVIPFPTPDLNGTQITGEGTYSYGYSQYPSTTG
jgi:penicillin-binding protein 1A